MTEVAFRMEDVQRIAKINRDRQKAICAEHGIAIIKGSHPDANGKVYGYSRGDFWRLLYLAGWRRIDHDDIGKIGKDIRSVE